MYIQVPQLEQLLLHNQVTHLNIASNIIPPEILNVCERCCTLTHLTLKDVCLSDAKLTHSLTKMVHRGRLTHLTLSCDPDDELLLRKVFLLAVNHWVVAPTSTLVCVDVDWGLRVEFSDCSKELRDVVQAVAQRAQRGAPCERVSVRYVRQEEAMVAREAASTLGVGGVVDVEGSPNL